MIDELDRRLAQWLRGVVGEVRISFAPPGEPTAETVVWLSLVDVCRVALPRTVQRPPAQLHVRYLVTVTALDEIETHRLLGALAFAAMDPNPLGIDLEPAPLTTWRAFELPPRAGVVFRIPVRRERPEPVAPRVRERIHVHESQLTTLSGIVLGPNDIPVADARVGMPAVGVWTTSDSAGRFRLTGVPTSIPRSPIRVSARGVEAVAEDDGTAPPHPLIIRLTALGV